jgi:hypothetical protein
MHECGLTLDDVMVMLYIVGCFFAVIGLLTKMFPR